MRKRWMVLASLVVVVVAGVTWLRNEKFVPHSQIPTSVAVSSWNSSIGAASNDAGAEKQKMSFAATIWNKTNRTVYVTNIRVKIPYPLQNRVLSGNTLIAVNESMTPNTTFRIAGQFVLDTRGMTKEQIAKLGNIEGFAVSTKS